MLAIACTASVVEGTGDGTGAGGASSRSCICGWGMLSVVVVPKKMWHAHPRVRCVLAARRSVNVHHVLHVNSRHLGYRLVSYCLSLALNQTTYLCHHICGKLGENTMIYRRSLHVQRTRLRRCEARKLVVFYRRSGRHAGRWWREELECTTRPKST